LGGFGQLCLRGHVLSACFVLTAGVQEWLLKGALFFRRVCLLFDVAQSTVLSVDHNSSEHCWGTPVNYVEAADRVVSVG